MIRRTAFVSMLAAALWAAGPIVHGLSPGRWHGAASGAAWADDGGDRAGDSADGDRQERDSREARDSRAGGDSQPADESQTLTEDGSSAVVGTSSGSDGSGASTPAPSSAVQRPADHAARTRSAAVPFASSGIRSGMLERGVGPLESGLLRAPSVQRGAALSFQFVRWLTYLGGGLAAAFSILIGAGFWAKRKVLRR